MADTPNILTPRQLCTRNCWKPPNPNTINDTGDIRRCEHGNIWRCTITPGILGVRVWDRLSWRHTPIDRWRAGRALRNTGQPDDDGAPYAPFAITPARYHRDGPLEMWAVTYQGKTLGRFDLYADAAADAKERAEQFAREQ